jgi:hypothetical protein
MSIFTRIRGRVRSIEVEIPPPQPRSITMSLHDTIVRLATVDDDDTALILATALNADQAIRGAMGRSQEWSAEDVKRVARTLADHAALNVPRHSRPSVDMEALELAVDQTPTS